MIDVHAHLCFESYGEDTGRIASVCEKDMDAVIVGSARYDEAAAALELCAGSGKLFPTVGYHPAEGGGAPERLMELARRNAKKIVGIGEVGLDYHWVKDAGERAAQKAVFSRFIELAEELSKPLVLHSWDAEEECFSMVEDASVPVVFHCYSGPRELAERIVAKGFIVSFSTQVLFSKAHRKLARDVPLESIVLETDSPFLSPVSYLKAKGMESRLRPGFDPGKNYPWNIEFSAEKIAEIKGMTPERVLSAADGNATRVFGLGMRS